MTPAESDIPTPEIDRRARFFDGVDVLFAVFDLDGTFLAVNREWTRLLGYGADELIGTDSWDLVRSDGTVRSVVLADLRASGRAHPSWRLRCADGSTLAVDFELYLDQANQSCYGIGRHADGATQRFEELERRAYTDPLTGLANRARIVAELAALVAAGEGAAALFCDIDHFKFVNDSLGHRAGDRLLRLVAERLDPPVTALGATLGRFGGDEFVVAVPHGAMREAIVVAEDMRKALDKPFDLEGRAIHLSMSVGIAVAEPGRPASPDELIANADIASYQAKREGRNRHVPFDDRLAARVQRRFDIEAELRRALDEDRIVPWYQPVVAIDSGAVVGAEALVRMLEPDGSTTGPGQFLDIAIDSGLITDVGRRVSAKVIELSAELARDDFIIGVNVSAPELLSDGFARRLVDEVAAAGLSPSGFVLEITESVAAASIDVIDVLRPLREAGFSVALDDFGVGQSSLSHLRELPIDTLKIDRSFVADLTTDRVTAAMTRFLIDLADSLGITVVAEGIETGEQADTLLALGAVIGQGWRYHPALPPDELRAVIANPGDIAPMLDVFRDRSRRRQ